MKTAAGSRKLTSRLMGTRLPLILLGAAFAWLPAYTVLIAVLFLPVLVVYCEDRSKGQVLTRMMCPFGAAALIRPVHHLWEADGSLAFALHQISDPITVLTAWLAGGAGWVAFEISLILARFMHGLTLGRHRGMLDARLNEIREEWEPASPASGAVARKGA